ncbi:eCIS core domain-containing protein [Burkholderia sp. LMU1-1-1.1]|uniref:eCIS core domain-containing protein n=1 Tax=Burkholderia sp. LMU1-1-1.1 TaxID=3135266 RepID=UPI00341C17B6
MRPERIAARAPVTERRPVAAALSRQAGAVRSPAMALRQRLGNQGTQTLIARSTIPAVTNSGSGPAIQCLTAVTAPNDPSEVEAHAVAAKVMRMPAPEPSAAIGGAAHGVVQRSPAGPGAAAPVSVQTGGGAPLSAGVRNFMEPRFGADFSKVRVHTGAAAATQSARLNANAFALGQNIYFGAGQYQPDTPTGKALIAHELTHTIQQGASPQTTAVRRSEAPTVSSQVGPRVQRDFLGIPSPRDYFAGKAGAIPGFTMLTVVIGFNPINNARVERSAGNILRGAIELIPGGFVITEALNNHGIFDKVSAWASEQFQTIKDIGASIWQDIENFIDGFSLLDLRHPGKLWDRAKAIVTRPIDRIIAFARMLKDGIVNLIKEAILKPIGAFARTTSGYPLLCTIMGKDPITGESVPQDPIALLGGFMKFIGEEEIWNNMQKANAIPRAFAWFNGALAALRGFLNEIPGLFVAAFKALEVIDILLIPRAFLKLARVFGDFAGRFISWGAEAAWNLLEIIFDVVSPGALAYIKKTGSALKSILKNPLPFVGNLVKAAKLGFINFGTNFLVHLKAGLIDWLTGSLPGIYIPKAFSLGEIAKFAFSVLGLSWANIRQKLVKATSEPVVKTLETTFDIVVTLVREGPGAAWEKIKEQLSNLKDMVIGGITDFVVDMVVQKAIPKMIAMFIPGAGFISAILSIYDTVMVFVNKISKIIQVVTGFIDSIVNIAAGNIDSAATKVETTLAGLLSLAINFLAGFAGMGKVADKIMAVFNKIRAPIDKALDALINWIVTTAKKLFAKLFGKKDTDTPESKKVKKEVGESLQGKTIDTVKEEESLLNATYAKFKPKGLKSIRFQRKGKELLVLVSASAEDEVGRLNLSKAEDQAKLLTLMKRFRYITPSTYIYTHYKGARIHTVSNYPAHAENDFAQQSIPVARDRILADLAAGKLTPTSAVEVTMFMTRTPCDGCATTHIPTALGRLKASPLDKMDIRLVIEATAMTQGATGEAGLRKLIDTPNVEVKASDFWSIVLKMLGEHPQFYDQLTTRHWMKTKLNEFQQKSVDLKVEIDAEVERKKRAPKDIKKG